MTNSMTINLDVFGVFMKSMNVGNKDYNLVITIHGHGTLYWKTKLLMKWTYPRHLRGSMHHSMLFSFSTRKKDNVLLLTPPRDKVPANKCAVPENTYPITTITCIAKVRVGLHVKMIVSSAEKNMFRSMLEIGKNKKTSLPMDLLGCIHKLAKETHGISDVRTCNGQEISFPTSHK